MIPVTESQPALEQKTIEAAPQPKPKRKPLMFWDRVKFVVLFSATWWILVWADLSDNPLLSFRDAVHDAWRAKAWIVVVVGIEIVRQVHYLISEHWSRYHVFWTNRVFGNIERRTLRINDWTRFRLGRAFKVVVAVVFLAIILGALLGESPINALFLLPSKIWAAMPFIVQMVFIMAISILQFVGIFWFMSRGGVETYFPDDIKTRFSDVWGQDAVLARVQESVMFLEDPEAIERRGGYVPSGILLWGPPGTGKTLMAEAVAGETGRPYVFVDPGAFQAMFFGVGIMKVKALFRKLRKLALRYGGVIVFFDEADSLGNRGLMRPGAFGGGKVASPAHAFDGCHGSAYLTNETASLLFHAQRDADAATPAPPKRERSFAMMPGMGGDMGTLQALLSELSGLKKPRGFVNRIVRRTLGMRPKPPPKYRILVMMATNLPEALDDALLRPGRIDRIYKVGYPSKAGRIRTYEGYFAKVDHDLTSTEIDKLANMTPYATGATIKDLVNESLIYALRDGSERISWDHVIKAKHLKDLGPPEDVEYVERERHATAVHEACHAVATYRVRKHLAIDLATIEKGGNYLGMVAFIPPEDLFTRWRSEYEGDVITALASLAGERHYFGGDSSSGVSGDLESATMVATMMEGFWGMGSTIASHGVTHQVGVGGGGRPGGPGGGGAEDEKKLLAGTLGHRIEDKLEGLYARAETLVIENRREIFAVAHALEANKTLTGEDVEAIIDGRQGPIIDGTIYAHPAFLEVAEAYHQATVEAHVAHGKVSMPLPAPGSWMPPEVTVGASTNGFGSEHGPEYEVPTPE